MKTLLGHGAAVNAKEGWHGQTALMWAAAEGYPDVVRALVASGADVHMRSNGGFTALLFAAREGRIAAVQALVAAGANMNDALPVRTRQSATAAAAGRFHDKPGGRSQRLPARIGERSLRAGRLVPRSRRRPRRARLKGGPRCTRCRGFERPACRAAITLLQKDPATSDSLEFVRKLVAKGAALNAPRHEEAVHGRHDTQLGRRNAVPARSPNRRRRPHALARRARCRSADAQRRRDDPIARGGRRRHSGAR